MADISEYIKRIEQAIRGEDVRDSIIAILEMLNDGNNNAYMLNGHPSSYFATQEDMDQILPLAEEAILGSQRAISSGGVYNIISKIIDALTTIMGEQVSGDITEQLVYINNIKKMIRKILIAKQVDVDTDTKFSEYPDLINRIPVTAAIEVEPLDVTENGEYKLNPGYAYNPVTVDVKPNVGQKQISSTGTFKAKDDGLDGYSEVTISVSGLPSGSGGSQSLSLGTKNITKDGTYEAAKDHLLGYTSVTVETKKELVTLEKSVPPDPGSEHTFDLPSDLPGWNKVTITVQEPVGPFKVEFYNKEQWLYTDNTVPAYGTCEYKGPTPERKGAYFTGWEPPPVNVTKDMRCYAQFSAEQPKPGDECDKTWEEVCADGGYSSVAIGEWKWLWHFESSYDKFGTIPAGKYKAIKVGGSGPGYKSMWLINHAVSSVPMYVDGEKVEKDGRKYYPPISQSANGWENSDLRKYLNGAFLTAISQAEGALYDYSGIVPSHIAAIPRYTSHYDSNTETIVPNLETNDKVWIPSYYEKTGKSVSTGITERGPFIDLSNVKSDGGSVSFSNYVRSAVGFGKYGSSSRYDNSESIKIDYISSPGGNANNPYMVSGNNLSTGASLVSYDVLFCLN